MDNTFSICRIYESGSVYVMVMIRCLYLCFVILIQYLVVVADLATYLVGGLAGTDVRTFSACVCTCILHVPSLPSPSLLFPSNLFPSIPSSPPLPSPLPPPLSCCVNQSLWIPFSLTLRHSSVVPHPPLHLSYQQK